MAESTHRVEIVPVNLEPHPNADTLSIVRVFDGYTCVVRTADWEGVPFAAYIPPDSVVPDTPDFAFLDGHRRIKARKLRGVMSMGLLVPAPSWSILGDDVAADLGITHYVPTLRQGGGANMRSVSVPPPPGCEHIPKYDLETFYKYGRRAFEPGEHVIVTEKIHGSNARYVVVGNEYRVGSRTRWLKHYGDDPAKRDIWWQALERCQALCSFLEDNPGLVVFGEVYGCVQDLRYGHADGRVSFAAFDVMSRDGKYLDWPHAESLRGEWEVPMAPKLFHGPFDFDAVLAMADGPSLIPGAGHIREGVVVRPVQERFDHRFGRTALKVVSNQYLVRAK